MLESELEYRFVRVCPTCRRSFGDDTVFCPRDATVLSLLPGTILLKKYKIVSEIARGGMAVVYRARHVHYDEEMALKILNEADQHAFVAEARVLRRLKHPHVVRVEDADFLEDGRPFLAMELIDGEDLAARLLRTGPMRLEEALRIVAEACSGLAAAHDAGMIHRDINPKNLLIARGKDTVETVKLIDFGIAKVRKEAGIGFTGVQQGTTGFFLGTPRYASPEQALLDPLDGRTDIYSMGLVLYEMLTGGPPSGGDSDEAILENQRRWYPAPPHHIRPDVPLPVSSVVMRALERDRAARYQTAGEMQNACESVRAALVGGETRRTRPEVPHAVGPKVEARRQTAWDYTRPSVAEPSSGTAEQVRVPVWKILGLTALVLALAVAALVAWRIVTERGSPSPSRTSDQTIAPRVESGKPLVPRREDRKVGRNAFQERFKAGTDVNARAKSATSFLRNVLPKVEQEPEESRAGQLGPMIRLTPAVPAGGRAATIIAPGRGLHKYTVVYLDTRDFADGGVLEIDIQISSNSATDGSFDLFPSNVPIPTQGAMPGMLRGSHDVRKGASTHLEYPFRTGQVFALGLEGNWFSPKGATGSVKFLAAVLR